MAGTGAEGSEGESVSDELSAVYARMAGVLLSKETVSTVLALITSMAADTIADSAGAGVTLIDSDGRPTTSAATDPFVERVDALQYELDEGPCLAAWRERTPVRSNDLRVEQRWPTWSPKAASLGVTSVISAPLVSAKHGLGAIKVYSLSPDAYTMGSQETLVRFAEQAAILVSNIQTLQSAQELTERLKNDLRTRDTIAMARGVLVAREGIGTDEAYRVLIRLSQRSGTPLAEIASAIMTSADASQQRS